MLGGLTSGFGFLKSGKQPVEDSTETITLKARLEDVIAENGMRFVLIKNTTIKKSQKKQKDMLKKKRVSQVNYTKSRRRLLALKRNLTSSEKNPLNCTKR